MTGSRLVWKEIRVLSLIAFAGFLLLLMTVVLAFSVLPALHGDLPGLPEAASVVIAFLLQCIIAFFLKKSTCPNCKGAFFLDPMSSYIVHPITSRCQFCGILKYSEIPTTKN